MAPSTTSAPLPTGGPTAGGDEFDDLFDYDIDGENDPFSANYQVPGAKEAAKESTSAGKSGANLGIDEEIEVTRKPRAPRVKLDENRLLSANGIPKLRKKAKDHLKLKGKGHEYSDASRLLAFYQLWLDDLFPKARFLDALAMVEKMGHKKILQTARMDWINEGKPKPAEDDTLYDDPVLPTRNDEEATASRIAPIFEKAAAARQTPAADMDDDIDMDDLYGATPRRNAAPAGQSIFGRGASNSGSGRSNNFDEGIPDDELDALLAEEHSLEVASRPKPTMAAPKAKPTNLDGGMSEDELDTLLAEEDEMMAASKSKQPVVTAPKGKPVQDDFDDEMEAMAEMDGMW